MLNRKQTVIMLGTLLTGWLVGWAAQYYCSLAPPSESHSDAPSTASPKQNLASDLDEATEPLVNQQNTIPAATPKPHHTNISLVPLSPINIDLKVTEIITMAYAYDVDQRLFGRANGYRKLLKKYPLLAKRLLENYFLLAEDSSSDLVKNLLGLYSLANHHALDNQLLKAVIEDTNRLKALRFAAQYDGFIDHDYSARVRDLLGTFYNNDQIAAGLRASSARDPLQNTKPGNFIQESSQVYAAYFDAPSPKVKAAALKTLTHFPQENEQQLMTEAMSEIDPVIVDEVIQLITNGHVIHLQSKPYLLRLANNPKISAPFRKRAISALPKLFELTDDERTILDDLSNKLKEI